MLGGVLLLVNLLVNLNINGDDYRRAPVRIDVTAFPVRVRILPCVRWVKGRYYDGMMDGMPAAVWGREFRVREIEIAC
jgi:hypothetical protein